MMEERQHTILSLDLGSTLGWAMAEVGVLVASGEVDLTVDRDLRKIRYCNFLIEMRGVDEIIYEKVMSHDMTIWVTNKKTGLKTKKRVFSVIAAHLYGWFEGELERFCKGWRIPLKGLHNATVKKEFTGNGKASKKDICAECHRRGWQGGAWGKDSNNNEADAIAMLYVELAKRGVNMVVS